MLEVLLLVEQPGKVLLRSAELTAQPAEHWAGPQSTDDCQPSDRSPPRAYFRDEDLHAGVLALHISFVKDLNAVRTCFVARTGCTARSSRTTWTKKKKVPRRRAARSLR